MLLLPFHLYADDLQILKPVEHPRFLSEAVSCLSSGVDRIASWMVNNKLKINCEKTEFLVLSSKNNRSKFSVDSISVCGDTVERVDKAKNLGLFLDTKLNMDDQNTSVLKACYFNLSWIRKMCRFIDADIAKALVHALVISRLDCTVCRTAKV